MVGLVCVLLAWIGIVVKAFGTSMLWGLACLFIPLVGLIFAVLNFNELKGALGLWAAGVIMIFVGGPIHGG